MTPQQLFTWRREVQQVEPAQAFVGGFGDSSIVRGRRADRSRAIGGLVGDRDHNRGCNGSRSAWDGTCGFAARFARADDHAVMITIPSGVRVLVATSLVDLEKGARGL